MTREDFLKLLYSYNNDLGSAYRALVGTSPERITPVFNPINLNEEEFFDILNAF